MSNKLVKDPTEVVVGVLQITNKGSIMAQCPSMTTEQLIIILQQFCIQMMFQSFQQKEQPMIQAVGSES